MKHTGIHRNFKGKEGNGKAQWKEKGKRNANGQILDNEMPNAIPFHLPFLSRILRRKRNEERK